MNKNVKRRKSAREPMVICICGLAGSGKSTLAKKLARKYRLKYYSGGDALKALAVEEGYKPRKHGWWETEEGMRFLQERKKNPNFDEAIDKKFLEIAKKGNVILDSWTMPWLLKEGFKIWLEASSEKRAVRIAKRDRMSVNDALKALAEKEARTRSIYKRLYGFNLGEDFEPFHLILDTDELEAEEVFQVICVVVDKVIVNSVKNENSSLFTN